MSRVWLYRSPGYKLRLRKHVRMKGQLSVYISFVYDAIARVNRALVRALMRSELVNTITTIIIKHICHARITGVPRCC